MTTAIGLDDFQRERPRLTGIAFRMLGTLADAEDAVQESYLRWHGLGEAERAGIVSPAAWLTRVVSRICLDLLGSARARRERYVGEWLPEPVPVGPGGGMFAAAGASVALADPLERVALDESVSTALLVVLESLTPAERVVFVLHEVFAVPFGEIAEVVGRSSDACRQLATSARRHVREGRATAAPAAQHDEVVRAFVAAAGGGDLAALLALLDPSVELRSDGGGFVSAARKPVVGALNVARFLLGIAEKNPHAELAERVTADGVVLTFAYGGVVAGVITLGVAAGAPSQPTASGAGIAGEPAAPGAGVVEAPAASGPRISEVWIMMNPEKLTLWR
ncbi:RNA polymerase sigma factor SigJ [Herbiconiux sp. 11R-BC]|uniref:RNA polymerase sigma factor SigJ n=1 Tax=Herbiconiux sp. 11R-BC TaxID=3111637 RepID=UPI003BFD2A79